MNGLSPIIGVSPAMKRAIALMERFAPTELAILLIGATGTGKELFARHIHQRSRSRGELVDVNCGALPHDMTESLLFGHRRGAFTGAVESVKGYLERAHGGTLFLDEILHLPAQSQVKLLRVLETGEVQPLGDERKHSVDFRIVAAAQDDIPARLDCGTFRPDLFQRLAGIVLDLPPLSDRPEDIVPLAEYFSNGRHQTLEQDTHRVLLDYAWPGNVRELRLAIERAGCLVDNGTLPPGAVRDAIALGQACDHRSDRRVRERRSDGSNRRRPPRDCHPDPKLLASCQELEGDISLIAKRLGVRRAAAYRRVKEAGISLRQLRKSRELEFHRNSIGIPSA